MAKHVHVHLGREKAADAEEGKWVTINGAHVLIKNGKITKGPPALVGKSHAEAHQAAGAEHLAKHDEAKKKGDFEQAKKHLAASAAHTNAGESYKQGNHGLGDVHAKEAEKHSSGTKVVHVAKPKPKAHEVLHVDAQRAVRERGAKKHQDEHDRLMKMYDESKADWERSAVNRKIERNMVEANQHHAEKHVAKARELSGKATASGKYEDHKAAHDALHKAQEEAGKYQGAGYAKTHEELQHLKTGHKAHMTAHEAKQAKESDGGPIAKAMKGMHEVEQFHPESVKHYNAHKAHTEDVKEGGKTYEVHRHGSFEGPVFAVTDKSTGKHYRSDKFHPVPGAAKKKENVSGITKPPAVGTPGNPADPAKKASNALGDKGAAPAGKGEATPAKVLGELQEMKDAGDRDKLQAMTKHPNAFVANTAKKHLDDLASKDAKKASKSGKSASEGQPKDAGSKAHLENAQHHQKQAEAAKAAGDEKAAELHSDLAGHHNHIAHNPKEDHSDRGATIARLRGELEAHEKSKQPAPDKQPAKAPGKAPSRPAKGSSGGGAVDAAAEAVKGLKDVVKKAGDAADPDPKKQDK